MTIITAGHPPKATTSRSLSEEMPILPGELFINRDLSLLEFNQRVLDEAANPAIPLLERLNYLCIVSRNLDEFFEVRVAGLKEKHEAHITQGGPDKLTPSEALKAISLRAHLLVAEQYRILHDVLLPELSAVDIHFLRRDELDSSKKSWLRQLFITEILPLVTPMGLDPSHPFPRILNKNLNLIVELKGKNAFGRAVDMAVIQVPRAVSRIIQLPPDVCGVNSYQFVFLSSVIHAFVDMLFPGMKVIGCFQFRVTRNSDLFVDEEEVDDLLRAMEGELSERRFGDAVRLEVADNCPNHIAEFLTRKFELDESDLYRTNGPVNLNRLQAVIELIDRPELKFSPFKPSIPASIFRKANLFDAIRKESILLHHPFESFAPVIEFLKQAAEDPNVLAIKQTLYRTGPDSPIVDLLVAAAKAGKQVTVVVELRARFDEESNIALANRLQHAGAQVVYGVVGFKTHAKLMLILRREGRKLRTYSHLATGNYHYKTSRLYTDYGLLTADKQIGADVNNVFMLLTSVGRVADLSKLYESPFRLHEMLLNRIEREIENALAGKVARIIVKCNAITEQALIAALYRASQAGVKIQLVVRGICCLRPGIKGVSDNIEVRSVIGRFLEHTRVYYFENGGQHELFCSSADWMDRNLFRRVEVCFPIELKHHREQIMGDLETYWRDNQQTWAMRSDGSYYRLNAPDVEPVSAQQLLLAQLANKL